MDGPGWVLGGKWARDSFFEITEFTAWKFGSNRAVAGGVAWQRNHLYPRIALNTMEGILRPFGGLTFPEVEYAVNPTLPFSIEFVSPRTNRTRVKTGVDVKPPAEELMLVGEPPPGNSWRMSEIEGGYSFTGAAVGLFPQRGGGVLARGFSTSTPA